MEIINKYFYALAKKQIQQFASLKNLYTEWNEKINVISRKDFENFYLHHVLHSLSIAMVFDFPAGYEIMDLGTGGGFPAIPLAIFFPEVHFNLVDSVNKKLKVAKSIADAIELKNISVQHIRAEDIHDKKFDVIVSRAVAPLKDIWHWSKPLLKKKPVEQPEKLTGLICLKGGNLSQEISKSGCHTRIWEIEKIFEEPFFKEKFILHIAG